MEEITEFTADKTPIEIALHIDDDGMTTARKLYAWLEFEPTHYARWCAYNITENIYVDENDYSSLMKSKKSKGNFAEDYKITASLAKTCNGCKVWARRRSKKVFSRLRTGSETFSCRKAETAIERAKRIGIRTALTDVIKASGENERLHGHAYSCSC